MLVYNMSAGVQVGHSAGLTGTGNTPSVHFVAGNRYQVFIRAVDGGGNAGAWSTPLEFDVVTAERLIDGTVENATPDEGNG